MPDRAAPFWSTTDVAEYLGLRMRTVSAYRQRGQMPPPDGRIGGRPVWRPATIEEWRPGLAGANDQKGAQA